MEDVMNRKKGKKETLLLLSFFVSRDLTLHHTSEKMRNYT